MENAPLSLEAITSNLKTDTIGKNVIVLDTIDSTNTFLKSLASKGIPAGTVVITEEQTAGRGRLGRTWVSQKGKNLTFSVLVSLPSHNPGLISLVAGIAVAQAIRIQTPLQAECKWPNDILINGKKVCGILSEVVTSSNNNSYVIIGIGVNVNQSEFPEEIQSTATSLLLENGHTINRINILKTILEQLEYGYNRLQQHEDTIIISEWKKLCSMIGLPISLNQNGTIITGIFADVADDGALLLQQHNGITRILSGEVMVVKSLS